MQSGFCRPDASGEKFIAGINDTGGQLIAGDNYSGNTCNAGDNDTTTPVAGVIDTCD
jgi:hypothetical protein